MFKKILLLLVFLFGLFFLYRYQKNIFSSFDNFKNPGADLTQLRLENEGLRQEVADLQDKISSSSQPYLSAEVYSRYPFSDNQILVLDSGSKNGLKVGMPVLAAENHLLGEIISVKSGTSEVRTIFSPDWKSSVRIGPKGLPADKADVEAVFAGGSSPLLQLIPADAQINVGDSVFSASPDLPLDLFIGQISKIIPQSASSLQQAQIQVDYDPEQLRKVFIISDYESSN